MISELRYGAAARVRLELSGQSLVAHCAAPRGAPLVQIGDAVDRGLAAPLDFPALSQAALPGDKVALAVEHGVPRAATIVAHTIRVLRDSGVAAVDIHVVRAPGDEEVLPAEALLAEVDAECRAAITVETHDPAERNALSYLAADTGGEPIYINRTLHDADLVVSIGCLRLEGTPGYYGPKGTVFPGFSDSNSVERFRSPKSGDPRRHEQLQKEVGEVSWLLGVQFTVQVVPAAGDAVLHVLAGEVDAVEREGERLCREAWSFAVPRRANLVVTTIEGSEAEQTWENVGRALASAARSVNDGGDVAICTELAAAIGPALQTLVGADDLDVALRDISKRHPADSLAAVELVRALKRGKVYLLSRLDEELVEELGMSPVAADQLSRLAARYDSCIVLDNAQYSFAEPPGEVASRPMRSRRGSHS